MDAEANIILGAMAVLKTVSFREMNGDGGQLSQGRPRPFNPQSSSLLRTSEKQICPLRQKTKPKKPNTTVQVQERRGDCVKHEL